MAEYLPSIHVAPDPVSVTVKEEEEVERGGEREGGGEEKGLGERKRGARKRKRPFLSFLGFQYLSLLFYLLSLCTALKDDDLQGDLLNLIT